MRRIWRIGFARFSRYIAINASESLKAEYSFASVLRDASADAPRAFLCEFVPRIKICIMYSRRYIQGWGGGRNAQRDERRPTGADEICAIGSVASG